MEITYIENNMPESHILNNVAISSSFGAKTLFFKDLIIIKQN